MAEPLDMTLLLLRDLRAELDRQERARKVLERQFDSIRQAINGESFLGRVMAAEIEDQLTAIHARLDALDAAR